MVAPAKRNISSLRDKLKGEKLKGRTQASYESRDTKGSFKDFFITEKMVGVKKWWAGKGDHIVDIIPYLAGRFDPKNKENDPTYVLDIMVHRNVGPMDDMIVCPEQYKKPCPICEHAKERNRNQEDFKTRVKPLYPSRRTVYNIIVRDGGKEEAKGIQVWEIAHWFFEKHIVKIARDPRNGGFTVFSSPDMDGKSISFERSGAGAESTNYTGHRFVDRPSPIKNEELDSTYCLDEFILLKSYDEIHELYYSKAEKPEEGDTPEKPQDALNEQMPEGWNEPLDPQVEEDERRRNMVEDPEKEEEAELQEAEKLREQRRARKAAATKEKAAKENIDIPKCPVKNGTIGKDIDEYDECDTKCTVYNQCAAIADTL